MKEYITWLHQSALWSGHAGQRWAHLVDAVQAAMSHKGLHSVVAQQIVLRRPLNHLHPAGAASEVKAPISPYSGSAVSRLYTHLTFIIPVLWCGPLEQTL